MTLRIRFAPAAIADVRETDLKSRETAPPGGVPVREGISWRECSKNPGAVRGLRLQPPLRASVGSTEASASLLARVGVLGPTRARGKKGDSLGGTTPAVSHPCVPIETQ